MSVVQKIGGMKKIRVLVLLLLLASMLVLLGGCTLGEKQKVVYKLEISGELIDSGVISYAGYSMNVYADQASNPCGDCEYQPVSVLKGDTAQQVTQAIIEQVNRNDDIWEVRSSTDTSVVLEEKEAGTSQKFENPETPDGLTIIGTYEKE